MDTIECPYCSESIFQSAKVCKHCGKKIKKTSPLCILILIFGTPFLIIQYNDIMETMHRDPFTWSIDTTYLEKEVGIWINRDKVFKKAGITCDKVALKKIRRDDYKGWAELSNEHILDVEVQVVGDSFLMKRSGCQLNTNTRTTNKVNLSFSNYQKIQTGMTYQEVVKIIGAEGEEVGRNTIDGVPGIMESVETVSYTWQNVDGSGMYTIFQNDKLFQKSQLGLK